MRTVWEVSVAEAVAAIFAVPRNITDLTVMRLPTRVLSVLPSAIPFNVSLKIVPALASAVCALVVSLNFISADDAPTRLNLLERGLDCRDFIHRWDADDFVEVGLAFLALGMFLFV